MVDSKKKLAAILVAAGPSSRLGQPKQLVEYEGESLVRRSARLLHEADGVGEHIIAVTGFEAESEGPAAEVEVLRRDPGNGDRALEVARDGRDLDPHRQRAGAGGMVPDETHFLNALHETIETGKTPADELLERYHGDWNGDLSRIYAEYSY